jgi:glutamate N-acetyltransferase/amino-acid N-acetyltransferase
MNDSGQRVRGFTAWAVAAGLKKKGGPDLALIFSERDANAAGVFTTNKVKAAPVILTQEHIRDGKARGILANAGNANACTGTVGLGDARESAEMAAGALDVRPADILVASTGVIGQPLNMDLIAGALPQLVKNLSPDGFTLAAQAIMTTDSFPKMSSFEGRAGGNSYRILGIAKGAGMIMPNMATMLCFVMTDISIEADALTQALLSSVEPTFNRISVDGDTSTNDTVLVLANGMAENRGLSSQDYRSFEGGLREVLADLALMVVRDGEGATKLVRIEIRGAGSASDALRAARTVANSSLVKTAFYGQDPNWGRILAALGRSGIMMEEEAVDIWIDDIQIVASGLGKGVEAEKRAAEKMAQKEFRVGIDLHQGPFQDGIITCDLTHEYVSINADYRT